MTPTLADILAVIEEMAPAHLAETWDNPGLQVGDPRMPVRAVMLALDATRVTLQRASARGAQLLLTHHPLIFTPLKRVERHMEPGTVIAEAILKGVAVAAAHTNLDTAPGGINDILADIFELEGCSVLRPSEAMPGAGLGRIGTLKAALSPADFEAAAARILGRAVRVYGDRQSKVSRMAVVGGSGGGLIHEAWAAGADLLLTGDIGHHHALEARTLGLALMDGGHFATEKAAFDRFAGPLEEALAVRGWEVRVLVDREEADPLAEGL